TQPWQPPPATPSGPAPSPIPEPTGYTPHAAYAQSHQAVNGTLILIFGILGLICCGFLAPVAWIMGNSALQTIDAGQGDPSQRQMVVIGRILGIIGSVLLVLGFLFYVAMFIFIGTSPQSTTRPPGSPF
ncbi:MAG: hypothetical protein M3347_05140, partial [Armatimonadota bacterium]|nr:hypothetical protein [Armatimonadota bacterium]